MLDKNNPQIADLVLDWIGTRVEQGAKPATASR
jgi:hypothetical protein